MKIFFSNISNGVKSSVVYTLSSLFSKGLAIITMPIFTRILSTEDIGVVNLYTSWHAMISVVSTLSLTSGGFQLGLKEFKQERDQYVSSLLLLTSLPPIVLVLVYFVNRDFWNELTGLNTALFCLMFVHLLLSPAFTFWFSRQRYEYKYVSAAIIGFSSAFLASLVAVLAVLFASQGNYGHLGEVRLFGNYSVFLIYALVIFASILYKGKTLFSSRYWKFSLSLSIPLIGNSLAVQILNVSDRTMIDQMVDKSSVGIYGTLYTVSSLSLIVWHAINASFVPFLFENLEKPEKKDDIRKISAILLTAFSAFAFLITLFAPEIVRILATEEYYKAIYIMPPIAAGIYLTSLSNMYTNLLIYYKKTYLIMIASVVAAATNVILNYFGIRLFGYLAAAYTTLIAFVILTIIQWTFANKTHSKATNSSSSVYYTKFTVLLSITTILLCMSCLLLYQTYLLRYLILASFMLIAYLKRNIILNAIKHHSAL